MQNTPLFLPYLKEDRHHYSSHPRSQHLFSKICKRVGQLKSLTEGKIYYCKKIRKSEPLPYQVRA